MSKMRGHISNGRCRIPGHENCEISQEIDKLSRNQEKELVNKEIETELDIDEET